MSNSVGRFDPNFSTMYYDDDQLGTSRLMISHNGYPVWQGTFLPYGEEYSPQMTMNHFKFTGKERDSENGASGNGLDYFGARYYSSALGRFITPDWVDHPAPVPYANIGNPQTLNLYGYVQNDPLSFVDPDGHCWSWAQHLCNFGQRIRNKWDGYGFRTDAQVEQAVHDAHNWLRQHGVTAEQQEKMTDKQALAVADAARSHKSSVVPDGVRFVLKAAPVVAGALPGANPQWGKNRFIKELQDRGFVYEGPTNSGDGLMYKNPTTGEEVRVMPNPGRTPYRGEPAAKFENDYYYRYRSGPDQAWGPAYNFAK